MQVKSKSGRIFDVPTPEEDAIINAGIAIDPDTYELNDDEFQNLMHFESLQLTPTTSKVPITIDFDVDVVTALKAFGDNWQAQINVIIRDWLKHRSTA